MPLPVLSKREKGEKCEKTVDRLVVYRNEMINSKSLTFYAYAVTRYLQAFFSILTTLLQCRKQKHNLEHKQGISSHQKKSNF